MNMRRSAAAFAAVIGLLVLAPSAAQAVGPAQFLLPTGGSVSATLYPGGLEVYDASPAYIVLLRNGNSATVESIGQGSNFTAVAVRDDRGGHAGMDCFTDAHLVIGPSFVSDFVAGGNEYHGLLMQYASRSFLRGDLKPADCGRIRSALPASPSITVRGSSSATLTVDCLTRICSGSFVTYGRPSSCSSPTRIGGQLGCLPSAHGSFTLSAGVTASVSFQLLGRPAHSTIFAYTVNGKLRSVTPLSSLRATPRPPPRPRRVSLSARCTSAGTVSGPIAVTGSLTRAGGRAPIALTLSGPMGRSSTLTTMTSAGGAYSAQFTAGAAGKWTVGATFAGDRTRRGVSSSLCRFVVT
jgi:hypothetical protein